MALSTNLQDREFTKFEEVNSQTTVRVKTVSNPSPNGAAVTATKSLSTTFQLAAVGVSNQTSRALLIMQPSGASARFSFSPSGIPAYNFPTANQPYILNVGPSVNVYIGSSSGTPNLILTEVSHV
jgi:hypothetical protein